MTVPIKLVLFVGLRIKLKLFPQEPHLNIVSIMHKLKLAFGCFVIAATLFNSGCANMSAPHRTMSHADLEWFVADCRFKTEQIAMLQAMRPTRDEKMFARLNNELLFWQVFTAPEKAEQRSQIGSNRVDWLINQHLLRLREC
jgi:hypothetical protein